VFERFICKITFIGLKNAKASNTFAFYYREKAPLKICGAVSKIFNCGKGRLDDL